MTQIDAQQQAFAAGYAEGQRVVAPRTGWRVFLGIWTILLLLWALGCSMFLLHLAIECYDAQGENWGLLLALPLGVVCTSHYLFVLFPLGLFVSVGMHRRMPMWLRILTWVLFVPGAIATAISAALLLQEMDF